MSSPRRRHRKIETCAATQRGGRERQEDNFIQYTSPKSGIVVSGVFDGHSSDGGGDKISAALVRAFRKVTDGLTPAMFRDAKKMKQFLTAQAFAIDEWLLKSQKDNAVEAGSTASLGFYDPTSNLFYVFNVGDSRTVWFQTTKTGGAVKKGTWHQSQDHKPSLASEIDRIERAGGAVRTSGKSKSSVARVDGVLALSRSFGDFSLKEELVTHRGGTGDWVTVKPNIVGPYRVAASVGASGAGEFYAVSGSDGVWDCMSSKEITRLIVASSDALKIQCRDLVQENIDRWAEGRGADNVTLTIMRIGSAKK